jgi:hypothetical protein
MNPSSYKQSVVNFTASSVSSVSSEEEFTVAMEMFEETEAIFADQQHTYFSSRDYEKFSLIYFNRPVSEEKVGKLSKAIQEGRNYLRNYPIIVNSQFAISDGQHRHAVAMREQLDLYYIIDDDFKMDDAIAANIITSGWTTREFMNSFAARGFPEYVKLKEFYDRNEWIKISTLPGLCSSKGYKKLNFNNGHYVANRMEYGEKVVKMVNDFRLYIGDKQAEYNPFLQTVMNLANNPNYNHRRMMDKLKVRVGHFQRRSNVPQYLDLLTEIYNYRVSPANRVLLTEFFIHQRWQRDDKE